MNNILLRYIDKRPNVFGIPHAPKLPRRKITFCFNHGIKIVDVFKIKDILGNDVFNQLRADLNDNKEISPELIHILRDLNLPRIKCKLEITLDLLMYKKYSFIKQIEQFRLHSIRLIHPGQDKHKEFPLAITSPELEMRWPIPGLKDYFKRIGLMKKGMSKKIMEKVLNLYYLNHNLKRSFSIFRYTWLDIHKLKLTLLIDENKIKLP